MPNPGAWALPRPASPGPRGRPPRPANGRGLESLNAVCVLEEAINGWHLEIKIDIIGSIKIMRWVVSGAPACEQFGQPRGGAPGSRQSSDCATVADRNGLTGGGSFDAVTRAPRLRLIAANRFAFPGGFLTEGKRLSKGSPVSAALICGGGAGSVQGPAPSRVPGGHGPLGVGL